MAATLWVHPFNGIAGDMFLGALIDVGADVREIRVGLDRLDVPGWSLDVEPVVRGGIGCVDVKVATNDRGEHRSAKEIIDLVASSSLPERVAKRSTAVFSALAEAEGRIHRIDPELVHFHEVGGVDAIIDIVGSCIALELLAVDEIVVAPVTVGTGTVTCAHGLLPNPAPATTRLLEGWPVVGLPIGIELTTPTGAALVRALGTRPGPMPAMTISATGFGAGDTETTSLPNLLQVVLGERTTSTVENLVVLETNVDDASGETLAHAVSVLLDTGARDAWITPIIMKKGRPAHTVSLLTTAELASALGSTLLAETGSLGFRTVEVERSPTTRHVDTIELNGHEIRVKVSETGAKAEYDDVAAAAAALGEPARVIAQRAEQLWAERKGTGRPIG